MINQITDVFLKETPTDQWKKVGAKLDIQYLGWGIHAQKNRRYHLIWVRNYDVPLLCFVINAQKGAYAGDRIVQKRRERPLQALDPAYIKGSTVNGKIYAVQWQLTWHLLKLCLQRTTSWKIWYRRFKREDYASLEPVLKAIEKIQTLFRLRRTRATVDLQMTSTMWLLMDFHSLLTWKGDTTKIVDRYWILVMQRKEDSSQILRSRIHSKRRSNERHWLWSFSRTGWFVKKQ